jgi:hypothetical protein
LASPYPLDVGMQTLIGGSVNVPVYKSAFVPSLDLKATPNGYVFFDIDEISGYHSSEGMAGTDGREIANFRLDIACAAHSNTQRKALVTSVLAVLQPIVSGRRTQLTSYLIGATGVFVNYLRLESQTETSVVKTGQSTPDLTLIVLSFSGKATC